MLINGINLYNTDIHHIPEYNWQKFQRCLLMNSGLGSDVQSAFARIDSIAVHHNNKRDEDFNNEILNLKLGIYSAIEGLSYYSMAFACLVKDIDGKQYDIKTDTDIKALSDAVAETGITHADIVDYVNDVKKKLIPN